MSRSSEEKLIAPFKDGKSGQSRSGYGSFSTSKPHQALQSEDVVHVVASNDTMASICIKYGVTVGQILAGFKGGMHL
jgi:LysM repeat protein